MCYWVRDVGLQGDPYQPEVSNAPVPLAAITRAQN